MHHSTNRATRHSTYDLLLDTVNLHEGTDLHRVRVKQSEVLREQVKVDARL